jgi:hypothetical protein
VKTARRFFFPLSTTSTTANGSLAMPSTSPAAHFSTVFSDYTASAAALDVSGVPTASQVPRRPHSSSDVLTHPHVLFEVEVDPESADTLLTLTLNLKLQINIGTETGQTTRAQAHAWLQALRSLFDDDHRDAWQTFIEAQTDDYREGWDIQAVWPQTITDKFNEEKTLLTLTAPFQVVTFWNN